MRRAEIKECIIDIGGASTTTSSKFLSATNGVKLNMVSAFRASTCMCSPPTPNKHSFCASFPHLDHDQGRDFGGEKRFGRFVVTKIRLVVQLADFTDRIPRFKERLDNVMTGTRAYRCQEM